MGEFVNEQGVKVTDTPVDLSKVCAVGFAHMISSATPKGNPTVEYDKLRIVYGNMDDANLGVTVIPAKDLEMRKESATFTTIDLRSLATSGYYGGKGMFMAERANPYNPDTSDWYAYELADLEAMIGTSLDVSYLLDASDHGKVRVNGDDFEFSDGKKPTSGA